MTLHSVLIQKLLSTNAHVGRRLVTHHFKLFTYGIRNRQAIVDSDKTLICLRSACDFIGALARQNARFMFVNTNPLYDEIVEQMTKKIGLYSPSNNILWKRGGVLTNSCSPKKFKSRKKKLCFGPIHPPDCVVIMDTEMKSSLILEAQKLQIPVVALVNSSMPWDCFKKITYPVPANDSVQFVYLFCNMITKTFLLEQKKLGAANNRLTLAEIESRKEGQLTEESKSKSKFENIELSVLPYEQLIPMPEDAAETKDLLDKLVVLTFNGALGTSMGFDGPKSAVEISDGRTFLDVIANQIESLNLKYGCNVPLLVLNSERTHDDTLKVLEKRSKSKIDIHTFKLSDQSKSSSAKNNEDDMYHADERTSFLSLMKDEVLDLLLPQGKDYVLVVSSNNVGTIADPMILNHLVQNKVECCMEVRPVTKVDPTHAQDKFKLGDIARMQHLSLQTASKRFKLVDTATLWADLKAVRRVVDAELPKEVDGGQTSSSETAAGSAIQFFRRAIGVCVPQSHYFPVNTTSDLLILQSDIYSLSEGVLVRNTARIDPVDPSIDLGAEFEKISDFSSRFQSIPSIVELDSLKVTGDVWFGSGITFKGNVEIAAKPGIRLTIPDGVVIEDKVINDLSDI